MKRTTKIILFLIVLATGIALALILQPSSQSPMSPPSPLPASPASWSPQENEGGNVTISVTPVRLVPGFPASFDTVFETHSVDLSFDVEKTTTLTDNKGNTYKPHWDGTPPGGHHRSGMLRFTPDLPFVKSITLIFTDIAGVPTRTFTWEVNR